MKHVFILSTSSRNKICCVEIMTVEFIPLSHVFIYLNIIILLKMGKLFTVIYTSTSVGFCKTRINQLACEESMEKLEIIFTFRFTVLFYATVLKVWFKDPWRAPRPFMGPTRSFFFQLHIWVRVFFLYMLCISTLKQIACTHADVKIQVSLSQATLIVLKNFKVFYKTC